MGHPITSYTNRCLLAWRPSSQQLETQGVQISPYARHLRLSLFLGAPKVCGAPSRQAKRSHRVQSQGPMPGVLGAFCNINENY